jgi:Ca-activated chloride channel homolog
MMRNTHRAPFVAAVVLAIGGSVLAAQSPSDGDRQSGTRPDSGDQQGEGFRFRTGVDLVNVAVTVTDSSGRFVPGLRKEDFAVYEDNQPQEITHFSAERVPVSLGIAIDTSGSMAGEKFDHAQEALQRFLYDLLDPSDEVFLYRFSSQAVLEQGWTTDRDRIRNALRRIVPRGGTAMYDAVAEAIPLAQRGENRKKALVVISDGNDTNSMTQIDELRQMIRESEVMVYAVGIDGEAEMTGGTLPPARPPVRIPWPFPGGPGRRWPSPPGRGPFGPQGGGNRGWSRGDERVNVDALRSMTDDSGGRTEIVRTSRDLDPATASIADELSKQYFLAYPAAAHKDGRWHSIRVEVKDGRYRVRARRGYIAT